MEYKCDICGKPATVHITKIIDGKKLKIHLCSECAEKATLDSITLPADIFPKIKQLEEEMAAVSKDFSGDVCHTCGASLAEVEKGARFSCPDCYRSMGGRLFSLLAQMHGATEHRGKKPKCHKPDCECKASADFATAKVKVKKVADSDILGELKPEFSEPKPKETKEHLNKLLKEAVLDERYEDAAQLRDKLKTISE